MSRYGDCEDGEDFEGQWALWEANVRRALKGRRGRKALADLRAALLALPAPRLIARALCTVSRCPKPSRDEFDPEPFREEFDSLVAEQGEGVCAVGAYAWWQKVKAGMAPDDAFAALPTLPDYTAGLWSTANAGVDAGLVLPLASALVYRNDEEYDSLTPEQRFTAFLEWIDAELGLAAA